MSERRKDNKFVIYIILIYLWVIITRPENNYQILEDLRIERLIMIAAWVALLLSGRINLNVTPITKLIFCFYIFTIFSYYFSPYSSLFSAQHWYENYWKIIVLYFLIVFSVNNIDDIKMIIIGLLIIVFLYQLHSWSDFVRGGSYTYQQGIRRIQHVWWVGRYGGPNSFSSTTLYTLPFAIFYYNISDNKNKKYFTGIYLFLSFLSIFYSGTRGALIGFIFFIMLNIGAKGRTKNIIYGLIAFLIILNFMPDDLKNRFFSSYTKDKNQESSRNEEIAANSAMSRYIGLVDGYELAKIRPLFGYGPETSGNARHIVNSQLPPDKVLKLHNLYGQIMGETGFVGLLLFSLIIYNYFSQLKKITKQEKQSGTSKYLPYTKVLRHSIIILLFYGLASHTLFRFYWILMFALDSALVRCSYDAFQKKTKSENA